MNPKRTIYRTRIWKNGSVVFHEFVQIKGSTRVTVKNIQHKDKNGESIPERESYVLEIVKTDSVPQIGTDSDSWKKCTADFFKHNLGRLNMAMKTDFYSNAS